MNSSGGWKAKSSDNDRKVGIMTFIKTEPYGQVDFEMTAGLEDVRNICYLGKHNDTGNQLSEKPKFGGAGDGNANHPLLAETNGFNFSTDDESTARCITNISSASSSISWAEDAVEAELTQQIFMMWENIQLICTGEVTEKPVTMPDQVFDECLSWKRAFPCQDLLRFSRFEANGNDFDELTSANINTKKVRGSTIHHAQHKSSPDSESFSSQSNCSTPNPEKNSLYITSWLADCQLHQSHFKKDTGYPATDIRYSRQANSAIPVHHGESNILAEDSSDTKPFLYPESISMYHKPRSQLRVQRPISSSVKGHLLTPLPTQNSHMRSIREASHVRTPMHFDAGNNCSFNVPDVTSTLTIKGKTAPVQSVNPPFDASSGKARSSGPRRTYFKMLSGDVFRNSMATSTVSHSYNIKTEGDLHSGSRICSSESCHSISSTTSNASSRVIKASFSTGSVRSGLPPVTSWSRHSSSTNRVTSVSKNSQNVDSVKYVRNQVIQKYNQPDVNIAETHSNLRPDLSTAGHIRPSQKLQPVRPFLYWLLDKVSPT